MGYNKQKCLWVSASICFVIDVPAYYFSLQVESLELSIDLVTILFFTSGFYLGPSFALGGGPTYIGILSNF
jgi:hypothetical protein